jgi:hypothetical protein
MRERIVALASICIVLFAIACSKGGEWGNDSGNPIASMETMRALLLEYGLREYAEPKRNFLGTGTVNEFRARNYMAGHGAIYIVTDDADKVLSVAATFAPGRHVWISNFSHEFWKSHGGPPDPERTLEHGSRPPTYSYEFSGEEYSGKWTEWITGAHSVVIVLNEYKGKAFSANFSG